MTTIARPTAHLAVIAAIVVAVALAAVPGSATAQDDQRGRWPILTVVDPTVERCGAVALEGRDFAPNTLVTIIVNGVAEEEPPTTDGTGSFDFTTSVACEQTSGFLQIRASDGEANVPIEITVGEIPQALVAAEPTPTTPSGSTNELLRWSVRTLLLAILAGELIALGELRRRRRRRPADPVAAGTATTG